jgi:putative intracellular protease/amidase
MRFIVLLLAAASLLFGASSAFADNKGPPKRIAILIFDGVEIIDYAGPFEVFGAEGFEVYTVAETSKPITTNMGTTVVPKYTFADAPPPDVVVVPGGGLGAVAKSAVTLKWIVDETARDEHTMSVCNGAFLLAKAGLLDGLTVTTTSSLLDDMRTRYPKTHVVDNQRFVDNGKIITTAGLSSGIDGALHMVALLHGAGRAQQTALNIEYDWQPTSTFTRASLADRTIPDNFDMNVFGNWTLASTAGNRDHWTMVLDVKSPLSATELLEKVSSEYGEHGHWTAARAPNAQSRRWTFQDAKGAHWTGTVRTAAADPAAHDYTVTLEVARAAKS